MSNTTERAQTPTGVNHLVLNVRDLEESHRFWTEMVGFKCVAELKPKPGRTMQMRFYSGVNEHGQVSHHDLALAQIPDGAALKPEPWGMGPRTIGVNHVAICYPTRDAWLKQVAFLKSQGVPIHLRIDHGMTHSIYISDPNGHGIEILYELPEKSGSTTSKAPRTTPSAYPRGRRLARGQHRLPEIRSHHQGLSSRVSRESFAPVLPPRRPGHAVFEPCSRVAATGRAGRAGMRRGSTGPVPSNRYRAPRTRWSPAKAVSRRPPASW